MQLQALIVDTFRESRDRKIFWVMLIISVAVSTAMFCIGFQPGKIDFLFGTWVLETDKFTVAGKLRPDFIASLAVEWIMDSVLGWLAVILALIATAGFLPSLMERGVVEVILSKPLPRWKIFLGKYLGSLLFFGFHAAIFVGLTFLVIGLRWGAWIPGYLWGIPLTILLFSLLYCVSALIAVMTRSGIASILITLGAWVVFAGVQSAGDLFEAYPEWKENRMLYASTSAIRWIVPKTQDLTYLARKLTKAASPLELMDEPESEEDRDIALRARQVDAARRNVGVAYTVGTSLAFEAIMVLVAMWRFSRRDY